MNIIDLHCDTIWRLLEEGKTASLYRNPFSVDIEKLQSSQAQAQFFALFVNREKTSDPLERALTMATRFFHELEENSQYIALARNYEELRQSRTEGKIAAFLTIEEGGVLKGDLLNLESLYRLGVRLITLTWNYPNEIGYPNCRPEYRGLGLTPFGEQIVAEMNRLGMLIDVSHLSDQGFYDVATLSAKPFTASHSNARSVTGHPRNLTDDMIKLLAEKGGVMGLNFEKSFLGNAPVSQVSDMVLHVKHIRKVGGIEVIAIGSDFDGIDLGLELAHAGEMSKLVNALERSGLTQGEIEKICWGNALRVIKDTLI
ncbi:dipeptidase [Sporomusa sp.]|uniref:dipeptidase n=1 Tax=Sporomusa sp. TaxID=2078658 RepID=UPI002C0A7073|nr:dipeptidase [Sporomusa sp.]HWR45001.1 dipeptidase [Sporomusa sp.]